MNLTKDTYTRAEVSVIIAHALRISLTAPAEPVLDEATRARLVDAMATRYMGDPEALHKEHERYIAARRARRDDRPDHPGGPVDWETGRPLDVTQ